MLHKYESPSTIIIEVEADNQFLLSSEDTESVMINVYDDSENEKYSVNDAL